MLDKYNISKELLEIEVTETLVMEEMDQQIAVMSSYYGYKPKELRANLEKSGNIDELHFNMLSAKVLQFVADNIKK